MTDTPESTEEALEMPAKAAPKSRFRALSVGFWLLLLTMGFAVGRLTAPVKEITTVKPSPAKPQPRAVEAPEDSNTHTEVAPLPKEEAPSDSVTISGTVLDERGKPIAAASLSIAGPPPRVAEEDVNATQGLPGELGVTSGPVPAIPVGEFAGSTLGPTLSNSDEQGHFSVVGVTRGQLQVIVSKPGFAARAVTVDALAAGNPTPLRVTLRDAGSLEGRIQNQASEPLSNALVIARGEDGLTTTAMSDATGAFKLPDLRGKVHAEAFAASHTKATCDAEVAAGGTVRCDFVLSKETATGDVAGGGRITGYVIDVLGRPVAGAHVWTDQGDATTTTNEDGEFTMAGIAPRALVILAEETSAGSGQSAQVRAREDETLSEVRIYLPRRFESNAKTAAPTVNTKKPATKTSSASSVDGGLALELRGGKVLVALVAQNAPESGLKVGDVLEQVDGEDVLSLAQARGMLRDPAGKTASVRVRRGSRSLVARYRRRAMPSL